MIITPLSVGAFQTNCYIVQDDNSTFLIDAPAPGEVIINKLKQNKLIPDLLILTHGHFDHVLGIKELKKEFPNLKIAISAHDSKYLLDGGDRITRDIAFFNIKPNFNMVKQPYKNPNDKRIKERIARGIGGGRLYDWWNVNQVKNVSKKDNSHPCVMPLKVMENIIGILPNDYVIVDPFMGSGTTGIACKNLNRDFIGVEIDTESYEIAKKRIESL